MLPGCAFASLPPRPARCTSAARARRSTTGCSARGQGGDARAAHRGHRPRALDARERRADPRRAALARARLGRRGADLPGRALRAPRGGASSSCSTSGHAYRSTAAADDVKAYKAEHGAERGFRGEDEGEGAVRLRVPDEGETVVHDLIRGETRFATRCMDDPVIARADGTPALQPRGRRRRPRRRHHARRARRGPPLQHAQAAARSEALGVATPRLRAPAAAARAGRQEALQAPRRGVGAGAARRRLPARGGAQLPRAARLGRRRGDDVLHAPTSSSALRARARLASPGACSTSRSCAG